MSTEQQIKAALDGTFTYLRSYDHAVIKIEVPLEFIPTHRSTDAFPKAKKALSEDRKSRSRWTPEEDAELLRLRRMGWTIKRCATALARPYETVRNHYNSIPSDQLEVL